MSQKVSLTKTMNIKEVAVFYVTVYSTPTKVGTDDNSRH
jgi:hypothetical protein